MTLNTMGRLSLAIGLLASSGQALGQVASGNFTNQYLKPVGATGQTTGETTVACPPAQPKPENTVAALWIDEVMIPPTAQCSSAGVDEYDGSFHPGTGTLFPQYESEGLDIPMAGITYSSNTVDTCYVIAGPEDETPGGEEGVSCMYHEGARKWMGEGFFMSGRPQLAVGDSGNTLMVWTDQRTRFMLQRQGATANFHGINGTTATAEEVIGSGSESGVTYYKIHDRTGKVYWFFGSFSGTITVGSTSGVTPDIQGQLWKVTLDNGETTPPTTYVGDVGPTGSSPYSLTNAYLGFELCANTLRLSPRVISSWDAAGRKYTFTYTGGANSSDPRILASAEVANGATTLASAAMTYTNGTGAIRYLSMIQKKEYLSNGTDYVVKYQYFRYDANGRMVLQMEPEGVRQAALSSTTFTSDSSVKSYLDGIASSSLTKYAASVVTYESSAPYRVQTLISNGMCGCSGGGPNGTVTYSYETTPGNTAVDPDDDTYDCSGAWYSTNKWSRRTTLANPDGSYTATYFDDLGQVLAKVRSSLAQTTTNASSSSQQYMATVYERDSDGRVSKVFSPESVATFDVGATSGSALFTFDYTKGQVKKYTYAKTGSGTGQYFTGNIVTQVDINDGTSTPGYFIVSQTAYEMTSGYSKTFGTGSDQVVLVRPLVTSNRALKNAVASSPASTDYDETTYAYTFWQSPFAIKTVTTTLPVVASGENGSGSSNTTKSWLRKRDAKTIFTKAPGGRYDYYAYESGTGLLTKTIQDADSGTTEVSTASAVFSGDTPSLPGTAFELTTTYAYDAASRPQSSTLPTGRQTYTYYTRLAGFEPVKLSFPKKSGSTFYGPVSAAVANQAGRSLWNATLTLSGTSNDTTTAIDSWFLISGVTPPDAMPSSSPAAAVVRMSGAEYDASGTRLLRSKLVTDWSGLTWITEDMRYVYDTMGRVAGTRSPAGTISRTNFDAFGRGIEQFMGTNDVGSSGEKFSSSGTDDMTKLSAATYSTYVPSSTYKIAYTRAEKTEQDADGNWAGSTDRRTTTYSYDYRNRPLLTQNPVAPHSLVKYDFKSRTIASAIYNDVTGLSASSDPTSVATANSGATIRLGLSESTYDSMGRMWKSTLHKVSQSVGLISAGNDLETQNWFDADGSMIKTTGPGGLAKYAYDNLKRTTRTYKLASQNDSVYSDADDVTGDVVLEESVTGYDATTGLALMTASFQRHHDKGTGVTGALDSNADGDNLKVTANDLKQSSNPVARAQISAVWYDSLDRVSDHAQFGTYALNESGGPSNFNRSGMSLPSRSDTILVNSAAYNKDGTVDTTTDPKAIVTKTQYDNAGRTIATISNYVNGTPDDASSKDDDHYVRYVYGDGTTAGSPKGLLVKMWVDLNGNNSPDADDQVTQYVYGTPKGSLGSGTQPASLVATGHLLREAIFPPQYSGQGASDRTVYTAYNAIGEVEWTRDQNSTSITTNHDKGGRITDGLASVSSVNIDATVQKISMTYTNRGQVETIVQYNSTSVALNGLKYTYDDWGNTTKLEQDHDSAVGSGTAIDVSWAYARNAPSGGRPRVDRTSLTLPGSFTVTNTQTASSIDALVGRVSAMSFTGSSTERVNYQYLGQAMVVGTELDEPMMVSWLHDAASPVAYDGMDRFNRIVESRWSRNASNHLYHVSLIYDRNSNITDAVDAVLDDSVGGKPYSYQYTMDDLNRVAKADRGIWQDLNGPSAPPPEIIGAVRHTQAFSLSQTGNWTTNTIDLDDVAGASFTDNRTFNNVNETLTRSSPSATVTHDLSGQMTYDGSTWRYKYDAFGRVVEVKNAASAVVAEYVYDGLGQRIGWHYDQDGSGVGNSDPWYRFIYDDQWRVVSTQRVSLPNGLSPLTGVASFIAGTPDTYLKERIVHHNAGLNGRGGSSYIDARVMIDRDLSTTWDSAADSTAETRLYFGQNWRADTSVIVNSYGSVLRWYKYTAYGSRVEVDAGDYNRDGFVDGFDYDGFMDCFNGTCVGTRTADADLDGTPGTAEDYVAFVDAYTGDVELNGGGIRALYAGYERDPVLQTSTVDGLFQDVCHVRHRVYFTELGTWISRDPLGYLDSVSLSSYCVRSPVRFVDAYGLCIQDAMDGVNRKCYDDCEAGCTRYNGLENPATVKDGKLWHPDGDLATPRYGTYIDPACQEGCRILCRQGKTTSSSCVPKGIISYLPGSGTSGTSDHGLFISVTGEDPNCCSELAIVQYVRSRRPGDDWSDWHVDDGRHLILSKPSPFKPFYDHPITVGPKGGGSKSITDSPGHLVYDMEFDFIVLVVCTKGPGAGHIYNTTYSWSVSTTGIGKAPSPAKGEPGTRRPPQLIPDSPPPQSPAPIK